MSELNLCCVFSQRDGFGEPKPLTEDRLSPDALNLKIDEFLRIDEAVCRGFFSFQESDNQSVQFEQTLLLCQNILCGLFDTNNVCLFGWLFVCLLNLSSCWWYFCPETIELDT